MVRKILKEIERLKILRKKKKTHRMICFNNFKNSERNYKIIKNKNQIRIVKDRVQVMPIIQILTVKPTPTSIQTQTRI